MEHDRHGAKQPHRFDPAKAGVLDDRARFEWLPPGEIFSLLDAPRNGLVVDFGTGTGTYALELARARPDVEVVALDEQEAMLEKLSAKLKANPSADLKPVLAHTPAAEALLGNADRVLGLNVLHEVGDAALREMISLLKPEGTALLIDWNSEVDRDVGPPRDHVYSPHEAVARVTSAGLRVLHRRLLRYHFALVCARAPEPKK